MHAVQEQMGPTFDCSTAWNKLRHDAKAHDFDGPNVAERLGVEATEFVTKFEFVTNADTEAVTPVEFVTEAAAFMTTSESTPANDSNALSDCDLPETQPQPPLSQESSDADSAETQILGRPVKRRRP